MTETQIASEAMAHARQLYTDGMTTEAIAAQIGKSARTIRHWAQEHGWQRYSSPEAKLEAGIAALNEKILNGESDPKDHYRLEALSRSLATLRKGEDKRRERIERDSKKPDAAFADSWAFEYQRRFLEDPAPLRIVKKARQIGFTFIIAWESLVNALRTGRDQGYMSASARQVAQIRRYVKQIARTKFGLKLKGTDVVRLPNNAELNFFATNAATAQGFTGNMYFDEFAWVRNAKEHYENAGATATLRDNRITILSTPSTYSHFFEEMFDPQRAGPNIKASRHLVTVIDAIEQGNTLIDLAKLLTLFSPEAIRRLYMCKFADDRGSVFNLDEVLACVHDDPKLFERRPKERIWAGVDVSRWRDDTSLMLLAASQGQMPVFTFRHRELFRRMPLPEQETRLKDIFEDWQPEEINVDGTTIGEQIADALQDDYPQTERVRFSVQTKARLVTNAQQIVQAKRLRIPFDQRLIDSFIAIKRKSLETDVGYEADGNDTIGHADDFWATALAMYPAVAGSHDRSLMIL